VKVVPLTLRQANELVSAWHRHHKPVAGYRFAIGAMKGMELVGAAIVGRPVGRKTDQYLVAEVGRLVTNGCANSCSFLYSASARIAREMGFAHIQTFILHGEPGTSLTAAGWKFGGMTESKPGKWHSRDGRRADQPENSKQRWGKDL
jgi:hypothetical protein